MAESLRLTAANLALLRSGLWSAGLEPSEIDSLLPRLDEGVLVDLLTEEAFLRRATDEKMLSAVLEYARSTDVALTDSCTNFLELLASTNAIQCEALYSLLDCWMSNDIEMVALKGTDLLWSSNPRRLSRLMVDLDFLISLVDLPAIDRCFSEAGFAPSSLDRKHARLVPASEQDTQMLLENHYELPLRCKLIRARGLDRYASEIRFMACNPYLVIGSKVYVSVAFDLHFNISTEFDIEDIWQEIRRFTIDDYEIAAQGETDLLWFLAARVYHEVMQISRFSMRQFFDVLCALRSLHAEIVWPRLLEQVRRYDLQPSLFYVLSHCRDIDSSLVPADVLDGLRPGDTGVKNFHDWGDFMPKLLRTSATFSLFGAH